MHQSSLLACSQTAHLHTGKSTEIRTEREGGQQSQVCGGLAEQQVGDQSEGEGRSKEREEDDDDCCPVCDVEMEEGLLTEWEMEKAKEIATEKFSRREWNHKR